MPTHKENKQHLLYEEVRHDWDIFCLPKKFRNKLSRNKFIHEYDCEAADISNYLCDAPAVALEECIFFGTVEDGLDAGEEVEGNGVAHVTSSGH